MGAEAVEDKLLVGEEKMKPKRREHQESNQNVHSEVFCCKTRNNAIQKGYHENCEEKLSNAELKESNKWV